jgi:tetratricopeptide (TPR) repeat protein/tRNA A-37 threonylcarbamoyl transferase component Bud32
MGGMSTQTEFVAQLFEAALALEPEEREPFLDKVCGDPEIRRMVDELLTEDARAGSFLEHPPFDFRGQTGPDPLDSEGLTVSVDPQVALQLPSPGRFQPGQVLAGRFVIIRFIAHGGMGEVYEAEDRFLHGARVALKTILPQIAKDPFLQQRFKREVLLAREVNHPNLCPIFDIFQCDQPPPSFLFLTMKLLPGETLAARLRGAMPISNAEGLAILKQMVAGLSAIHGAGIVHRDIKPNNIILDGSGPELRLVITDFGLARSPDGEPSLPGIQMAGTPDYMAPELYQGSPPSQASDLFAFGVVLHQVFTGQKPSLTPDSSSVVVSPRLSTSWVPSFCVRLITECLHCDPKRRCQAFAQILETLQLKPPAQALWTRRRFAGAIAASVCAVAAGAWWKRDQVEDLLHPLPRKRFVALLSWPQTSDMEITPMVTSTLTAIKGALTHFETRDKNLFVISPEDADVNTTGATHLKEVCDPLGANLVLAAAGVPGPKHLQLFLRLIDPVSGQALREKKLTCAPSEVISLPGRAVRAAASLLDLTSFLSNEEQADPGTQSVDAFKAFQSAEALMKQPNESGLEGAIEKYKQAVSLDSHYAVAYARLAQAYARFSIARRNSAALDLARGNSVAALRLDQNLVEAHLALALVLELSGDEPGALQAVDKALALDPSNPRTLITRAQIYSGIDRREDAEKTLRRILNEHPNNWLVYDELGFLMHGQARYKEAIQAYQAASLAAPANSYSMGNLGVEYLETGEFTEGTRVLRRAFAINPASAEIAANISLALRYQGKYKEALPFARKAVDLNPGLDTSWLELGDCYSSLPNHQKAAKEAYLRAAKEVGQHLQIDQADGASWMLLALYDVKSGAPEKALSLVERAEKLGAHDMDSQFYKARVLELTGHREDALTTLAACFKKGAGDLQVLPAPDLEPLRKDSRYGQILQRGVVANLNAHQPYVAANNIAVFQSTASTP